MTRLADKFDPVDVVAIVIIVACITSMAIRGDQMFKDVLQTVVGFYFGRKMQQKPELPPDDRNRKNGQNISIIIFITLFLTT